MEAQPAGEAFTIFALRTTANREDQVMDFVVSNAKKKGIELDRKALAHLAEFKPEVFARVVAKVK